MSKPLRYGPVTCPITGKTLTTYSQLTAVNYYSPKAGEVVTKFLNLDNQAPEVKVHTDAIRNAISRKPKGHDFEISRQSANVSVKRHMSLTGG